MCIILCVPIFSQPVFAEWESDNWLSNIIGPERILFGDEFGCQGLEGIDAVDEVWTIESCKEYLMGNTHASRWGESPISFGLNGLVMKEVVADELVRAGFKIVGDTSGDDHRLEKVELNGGSLEKKVANTTLLDSFGEDSLVSIEWIARIHDLRVREDKDAIEWLEKQAVWFTTWGEWNYHNISGNRANFSISGNFISVSIPKVSGDSWSVPGTVKLLFNQSIISVYRGCNLTSDETSPDSPCFTEQQYPEIAIETRHLSTGWRPINGGVLITMNPGEIAYIELDGPPTNATLHPVNTFNDLHHSVTIVGIHTTNLFQWSSDFVDSPLRFTWLLVQPSSEELGLIIPALAVSTLIATPIVIRYLLKNDGLSSIDDDRA